MAGWAVLSANSRTMTRTVHRRASRSDAEASAARLNETARKNGMTHIHYRAMTLEEAERMAAGHPSAGTRRALLKQKGKARRLRTG